MLVLAIVRQTQNTSARVNGFPWDIAQHKQGQSLALLCHGLSQCVKSQRLEFQWLIFRWTHHKALYILWFIKSLPVALATVSQSVKEKEEITEEVKKPLELLQWGIWTPCQHLLRSGSCWHRRAEIQGQEYVLIPDQSFPILCHPS